MVCKHKVRKLKTLCHLATSQTSQLHRPKFTFLGWFSGWRCPNRFWKNCIKPIGVDLRSIPLNCVTRFDSRSFAAKGLFFVSSPSCEFSCSVRDL